MGFYTLVEHKLYQVYLIFKKQKHCYELHKSLKIKKRKTSILGTLLCILTGTLLWWILTFSNFDTLGIHEETELQFHSTFSSLRSFSPSHLELWVPILLLRFMNSDSITGAGTTHKSNSTGPWDKLQNCHCPSAPHNVRLRMCPNKWLNFETNSVTHSGVPSFFYVDLI